MIDIHLMMVASKKAGAESSQSAVEGIVLWVIHHLSILDETMRLLLTFILILSALVRFGTGALKFYYTIKNKGVDGD